MDLASAGKELVLTSNPSRNEGVREQLWPRQAVARVLH